VKNLAASNIAWPRERDAEMYRFLAENGFTGLEVAPARLFPPGAGGIYKRLDEAAAFAETLRGAWGLRVVSMQSIWRGRAERLFGSPEERRALAAHTRDAARFARALGCGSLVFGCPRNRAVPAGMPAEAAAEIAAAFFAEIADAAAEHGAVIALEPNPPIYDTNFVTTTAAAFALCAAVSRPGLKVNVDAGAMLYNHESADIVAGRLDMVSHIHVSEPGLGPVERRPLHRALAALPYTGFFSLEMRDPGDIEQVKQSARLVKEALS